MTWKTAKVFLPDHHARKTPELTFLSTCAIGMCECNNRPVHGNWHFHEHAGKKQLLGHLIKKNQFQCLFIIYLRFILSILVKIFYYIIFIIKINNLKKFKFKFKRHEIATNCHQVMLIKHNLPPIDTNFFQGGIPYVH